MSRKRRKGKGGKGSKGSKGSAARTAGTPGPGRRPLSRAKIRRRLHLAAGALLVAIVVAALWWLSSAREQEFAALAAEGRGALQSRVTTEPSAGRDHVSGSPSYGHRFPTSGVHSRTWVEPGVYGEAQRRAELVHALEHGNIVIYYDRPASGVMERLRSWASLYDGQWSGLVVVPAANLGDAIVLTAWTKRLRLDTFDPAVAAAFIDAYRGRGPENPVR